MKASFTQKQDCGLHILQNYTYYTLKNVIHKNVMTLSQFISDYLHIIWLGVFPQCF